MRNLKTILALFVLAASLSLFAQNKTTTTKPFTVVESGIPEIQAALKSGKQSRPCSVDSSPGGKPATSSADCSRLSIRRRKQKNRSETKRRESNANE